MLLTALLLCSSSSANPPGSHGDHAKAHHRFDDAEKWSKVFDDPKRDAWQQPAIVVEAMAIEPGMVVADIGAGTGYFNGYLAAAVGPEGKVIAVDIEPNLIDHMKKRAEKESTPQVEARLTQPDASGLQAGEVDRVILVDTYHHIQARTEYFKSLRENMKKGGKLAIVDLTKEAPFGPPVDQRLTAEQVTTELAKAGWTQARVVDGLQHQYMVVYE